MKRMNLTAISTAFVFFALLALPATARAQTTQTVQTASGPTEVHELVLRDGSRLFGSIERETETDIVFRTQSGAMVTARRIDVVSLRRVKGRIEEGEFLRTDLHRSRLFFAPTGRSLDKGQVSVGVFEFLAPFVQVGVTDRFSIGGGTPLVFGIDEDYRPFWLTPKFQVVRAERVQAAVGVLQVLTTGGDTAGIAYGVSTFGNSDNALTVGGGMAYADDGGRGGIVMIGGEGRVRNNLKLITENYIWKGGDGILSGGVRFIGERLSADLGLAFPIGAGDFFAFPVVSFVYVF
jgi:hypothetical protein